MSRLILGAQKYKIFKGKNAYDFIYNLALLSNLKNDMKLTQVLHSHKQFIIQNLKEMFQSKEFKDELEKLAQKRRLSEVNQNKDDDIANNLADVNNTTNTNSNAKVKDDNFSNTDS